MIDLEPDGYGTHTLGRTKGSLVDKKIGNGTFVISTHGAFRTLMS